MSPQLQPHRGAFLVFLLTLMLSFLSGSTSSEVGLLTDIVTTFTDFRLQFIEGKVTDLQGRALASSQPLLVYVCISLHVLLRQSNSSTQRVRAQDLALCFSGIMASVLDILAPGTWSLSNIKTPLTVAIITGSLHSEYVKAAKDKKLPEGLARLASQTALATNLQARGSDGTYECDFVVDNALGAKLSGMVAAADASDRIFNAMESERLCWEAAGLPVQFGSLAAGLTLQQEVAAIEGFISFIHPLALQGVLQQLPGGSAAWGPAASVAAAASAAASGSGGDASNLDGGFAGIGIRDFDTDADTGLLTYRGAARLSAKVLDEINGWRIPMPANLQGNGLVFVRLKKEEMEKWSGKISKAHQQASVCDKALLGSRVAASNFCAVHHGVWCSVVQVIDPPILFCGQQIGTWMS